MISTEVGAEAGGLVEDGGDEGLADEEVLTVVFAVEVVAFLLVVVALAARTLNPMLSLG